MAVILARPPISFVSTDDENQHIAKSIAFHVLSIFVADTKDVVSKAVSKSINTQLASPPPLRTTGRVRQEALIAWKGEEYPLAWWGNGGPDTAAAVPINYLNLQTLLTEDPLKPELGLIQSTDRRSYNVIVTHLLQHGVNGFAPSTKTGYFHTALPLAFAEMKKYSPDPETSDAFATAVLAYMMIKLKIHFVPWHKASIQRGSPPPSHPT